MQIVFDLLVEPTSSEMLQVFITPIQLLEQCRTEAMQPSP